MESQKKGSTSKTSRKDAGEDDANDKRGKVRIQNVGGSLTVLLQLAILAFGVRHLRNILAKRKKNGEAGTQGGSPGFAVLTKAALKMLIELDATPFQLLDVRTRDEAKANPLRFAEVVNIPDSELRGALQLPPAAWEHRFGASKQPDRRQVLIFLSSDNQKGEQAASLAASLGYSRCCVLKGGLKALENTEEDTQAAPVKWINRDALAVLMLRDSIHTGEEQGEHPEDGAAAVLLDVRRHDERVYFGSIPHSRHLPVDQLALALASDDDTWQRQFHQPKPLKDGPLIMQCRTNRRAQWAAQLAFDAGYENCYVYKQGVFGWHLHPSVMAYTSYEDGDPPPEPVSFAVETVDKSAGEKELQQLGLWFKSSAHS